MEYDDKRLSTGSSELKSANVMGMWLSVASSRQRPRPWKASACEHFGRHEHRTPTQGYAAT
jgi:hypothetical protein